MEYIPIEKENIPYIFSIQLGAEIFEMAIRYNDTYDFFTVDLFKNEETLVVGEKMVYGVPLFADVYDERFPAPTVVLIDQSGKESMVTFENFNETVFLVVMNE